MTRRAFQRLAIAIAVVLVEAFVQFAKLHSHPHHPHRGHRAQRPAALAQFAKLDWKVHDAGKMRQVINNMGTLSRALTRFPGLIFSEFPAGSDEEHLYQGGM